MPIFSLGFLSGMVFLSFGDDLPFWQDMVRIALLLVCLILLVRPYAFLKIFSMGFFFGFLWMYWNITLEYRNRLPKEVWEQPVWLEGKCVGIPKIIHQESMIDVGIERFDKDGKEISLQGSPRIRLKWKQAPNIEPGDRFRWKVQLKSIHGSSVPGLWNQEMVAFSQHLRGKGRVIGTHYEKLKSQLTWIDRVDRARWQVTQTLMKGMTSFKHIPLMLALTNGVRDGVSKEEWKVFRATGTTHLMAISGLHVGLIAGCVGALFTRLIRFFPKVFLYLPAPSCRIVIGGVAGFFYTLFAGVGVPTTRSFVTLVIWLWIHFSRRFFTVWWVLGGSLFLVLCLFPLAVLSMGFWLSFSAVFWVILASQKVKGKKKWQQGVCSHLIIGFGLMPLSILFFQQFSWIGLIANVFAIPWMGMVALPVTFAGVLSAWGGLIWAKPLLFVSEGALHFLWKILEMLSRCPGGNAYVALSTIQCMVLQFSILGIVCATRKIRNGMCGVGLCAVLIPPGSLKQGEWRAHVLDVGQGLSVVVETKHHVLVYDTGPRYGDFDMGERVVVPFLRTLGIKTIDKVVVSHGDMDHRGGFDHLMESFPIQAVLTSEPKKIKTLSIPTERCQWGQSWTWDGVVFSMMHPPADFNSKGNQASCVLWIKSEGGSLLLPGDIGKEEETMVLKNISDFKQGVVVAPHHGSGTSSSWEWVTQLKPAYVIFSVGSRNAFHFPKSGVVRSYLREGASLYRTDQEGTVTIVAHAKESVPLELEASRRISRHYWNDLDS